MTVRQSRLPATVFVATAAAVVALLPGQANAAAPQPPRVTVERGNVLGCTGQADGVSVYAELYENSAYGAAVSLRIETPDGNWSGAWGMEPVQVFRQGRISASVPLGPAPGEEQRSAREATISGTYARTGLPTRVHDVVEDAGQVIVTDGINRRLTTSVTVAALGHRVPLACDPAFAFDLIVRRTAAT